MVSGLFLLLLLKADTAGNSVAAFLLVLNEECTGVINKITNTAMFAPRAQIATFIQQRLFQMLLFHRCP